MARSRIKAVVLICAKVWFVGMIATSSTYCARAVLGYAEFAGMLQVKAPDHDWSKERPGAWQALENGLQRAQSVSARSVHAHAKTGRIKSIKAISKEAMLAPSSPERVAQLGREGAGWLLELYAQRAARRLSVEFVFEALSRGGARGWIADNAAGSEWGDKCRFRSLIPSEMGEALESPGVYQDLSREQALGYIASHESAHCASALDPALGSKLSSLGGQGEWQRMGEAVADLYAISQTLDERLSWVFLSKLSLYDPRDVHSNASLIASALRNGAASNIRAAKGRASLSIAMDEIDSAKARADRFDLAWSGPKPTPFSSMILCRMESSDQRPQSAAAAAIAEYAWRP